MRRIPGRSCAAAAARRASSATRPGPGEAVVAGEGDPAVDFVDPMAGAIVPRPVTGLPEAMELAVGTEWSVADVPEGTTVLIDATEAGVVDGTGLVLEFPLAGHLGGRARPALALAPGGLRGGGERMKIVADPTARLAARRAEMRLTARQLFIGLERAGFITEEEAIEAARTGALPAAVEAAIAMLPAEEQTAARITWARMTLVERTNPMVALLGAAAGRGRCRARRLLRDLCPDLTSDFSRLPWRLHRRPQPARHLAGLFISEDPVPKNFYENWRDVPKDAWRWPDFSPAEIACRGTGRLLINEPALDKLQALRDRLGKPLIVRSGYRSPEHNSAVGGAARSKHLEGAAFDIAMRNHDPHAFEAAARAVGFKGFGFYPALGLHAHRSWTCPDLGRAVPEARDPVCSRGAARARGAGREPDPERRWRGGRGDDRRRRG